MDGGWIVLGHTVQSTTKYIRVGFAAEARIGHIGIPDRWNPNPRPPAGRNRATQRRRPVGGDSHCLPRLHCLPTSLSPTSICVKIPKRAVQAGGGSHVRGRGAGMPIDHDPELACRSFRVDTSPVHTQLLRHQLAAGVRRPQPVRVRCYLRSLTQTNKPSFTLRPLSGPRGPWQSLISLCPPSLPHPTRIGRME